MSLLLDNFSNVNFKTSPFDFVGTVHFIILAPAFLATFSVSSVQLLGIT